MRSGHRTPRAVLIPLSRLLMHRSVLPGYIFSFAYRGPPNIRNMSTRSYKDAIDHLNTLQSNSATLDAIRASGTQRSAFVIPEMREYLGRIGYSVRFFYVLRVLYERTPQPDDLNKLNVIHITGTKGKGSTSAFVDSIIRQCMPQWKVGALVS